MDILTISRFLTHTHTYTHSHSLLFMSMLQTNSYLVCKQSLSNQRQQWNRNLFSTTTNTHAPCALTWWKLKNRYLFHYIRTIAQNFKIGQIEMENRIMKISPQTSMYWKFFFGIFNENPIAPSNVQTYAAFTSIWVKLKMYFFFFIRNSYKIRIQFL